MRKILIGSILLPVFAGFLTACGANSLFQAVAPSHDPQEPCGFVQNVYGERISWKGKLPIQVAFHSSVPSTYYSAIESAFRVWEKALGRPLFQITSHSYSGPLTPRQDGVNLIYWMNTWEANRTSEQARTSVYWVGNQIKEADIRINAKDFTYYLSQPTSYRDVHLESLLVHEIGHVLGLKHQDAGGSVMATYLASSVTRTAIAGTDLESARCEY